MTAIGNHVEVQPAQGRTAIDFQHAKPVAFMGNVITGEVKAFEFTPASPRDYNDLS